MTVLPTTAASLLAKLNSREITSEEVVRSLLDRAQNQKKLNVFVHLDPEATLAQARAIDVKRATGAKLGPLAGVPVAIKDVLCVEREPTSCGSRMLRTFKPPYDATVIRKLRSADAILFGKTNMDEFAMGSSNMTSAFGPVENPWKRRQDAEAVLVPGGSSGGSAAAVAARIAMGGTGTDTGGSIRQPASFCGLVGVKPTYGRCSRWGVVAFASSLDHPGPFSRTVRDGAILLGSMAGHDPKDSTSADVPVPDFEAACARGVRGLRIGVPREYRSDGMSAEIEALWARGVAWLREAGAEIVDVSLPHTKYGLAAYYIVAPAEASSNLARYDGVRFGLRRDGEDLRDLYERTRAAGFGAEVRRRVLIGTYVLSAGYYDAYYLRAQKVRALILRDFTDVFAKVDALLTPTTPSAAFAQGEKMDDPITMYLNDVFTVPANLAGVPAASVPAGLDANGLPLGLQVIGRPFDEETMFAVAAGLERAAGFEAVPVVRAGG
jgi:aspartyl-tRNA(Asn)/glutamyl-tRNA(Gln) amidotransferase subunit A